MNIRGLHIISGIFVIFALFFLGYFTVIKKKGEGTTILPSILVDFPTVEGLKYGNPVFVQGLPAGDVSTIQILENKIRVKILLEESVQFYRDYSIILKNFSVFGKKAIYIQPGREKFGPVPSGTILKGKTIDNPFDLAAYVLTENRGHLFELLQNIAEITGKINDSSGSISLFINDPTIYLKSVKTLKDAKKLLAQFRDAYYRYRTEIGSKTIESAIYQIDE